jgi:hypothetical protein
MFPERYGMIAVVDSYDLIAVVVRFHRHDTSTPEHLVDLMRAFRSVDEADVEAARLNEAANQNPRLRGRVEYFVKIARHYPEGRPVT